MGDDIFRDDDGHHEISAGYREKSGQEGAGCTSSFHKTCTSHFILLRMKCLYLECIKRNKDKSINKKINSCNKKETLNIFCELYPKVF